MSGMVFSPMHEDSLGVVQASLGKPHLVIYLVKKCICIWRELLLFKSSLPLGWHLRLVSQLKAKKDRVTHQLVSIGVIRKNLSFTGAKMSFCSTALLIIYGKNRL